MVFLPVPPPPPPPFLNFIRLDCISYMYVLKGGGGGGGGEGGRGGTVLKHIVNTCRYFEVQYVHFSLWADSKIYQGR